MVSISSPTYHRHWWWWRQSSWAFLAELLLSIQTAPLFVNCDYFLGPPPKKNIYMMVSISSPTYHRHWWWWRQSSWAFLAELLLSIQTAPLFVNCDYFLGPPPQKKIYIWWCPSPVQPTIVIDDGDDSLLEPSEQSSTRWIRQLHLKALILLILLVVDDGDLDELLSLSPCSKTRVSLSSRIVLAFGGLDVLGLPGDLDLAIAAVVPDDRKHSRPNALLDDETGLGEFQGPRLCMQDGSV